MSAAHRQPLFISLFFFLAAFALHVHVCYSKAAITILANPFKLRVFLPSVQIKKVSERCDSEERRNCDVCSYGCYYARSLVCLRILFNSLNVKGSSNGLGNGPQV